MGTLFRSEEMTLCQLFLQSEAAYSCISELGELGVVQFRDLNPDVNAFQRKYVNEIRRCDEMHRILRFLEKETNDDKIPILDLADNPEAPSPPEMVDLETTLEKLESDLKEVNQNYDQLRKNYRELNELKYILRKAQSFFDESDQRMFSQGNRNGEDLEGLLDEDRRRHSKEKGLGFITGVITRDRMPAFEKLLWRACRGTAFLKYSEIETGVLDPVTGVEVNKCVVMIFYQGEQLKARIRKICDAFHVTVYPCPDTEEERRDMSVGVMTRIEDLNIVLNQTKDHRQRILMSAAQNLRMWKVKNSKIRAIYHTLNMFNVDITNKCLIGECWCAVADLEEIQSALRRGTDVYGGSLQPILNRMQTSEMPPTYNRINKFTRAFQTIVDAYGVGRYQEANPAPFTVITFPFLFGVMFGDCGHGLIMFLAALWMVVCEKKYMKQKSTNEIWNTFFGGRYIITLMGLFAIYSGLMYNDCYSRSLNIFGSSWYPNYTRSTIEHNKQLQLNPTDFYSGSPYPFGEDPVWQVSKNQIIYLNSMKMKLSVILGVFQMMFGVFLSCTNHIYFKDRLSIFTEFIPQVLFLGCIFGYLIILIFWKWIKYTTIQSNCAPSLLIGLINMFMFKYPKATACNKQPIYGAQPIVQSILVIVAVLCVPWMLVIKPCILYRRHRARSSQYARLTDTMEVNEIANESQELQHSELQKEVEGFNFGDIVVHQCIHTIEYCLGCISNTASYLRLWALSLAHAELSLVLWEMVLRIGLKSKGYYGGVMIFLTFAFWAVLTIAILLLMEGLSAFLHALRLHWVEFQNKFYHGDGFIFMPFSFQTVLDEEEG